MIHTLIHPARWRATLCALFALLTLTACDVTNDDRPDPNITASSLSRYNFSSEGVQEFYVDGVWGSGVGIGSGGGSVCCVMIPNKWHEGLQVTVEWRRSDCGVPKSSECTLENVGNWPKKTLKKTVPIEPYDVLDETQVFFLPNDEIKIYVTDKSPWHAGHPSKLLSKLGDIDQRPFTDAEMKRFMEP
ncbi:MULTISPECIES: DUF3304 domain-containing protein [Denitromonas]|uniref:DUF3304 domain-containing protein n=2 Tax=Denitromonas TaxID=139331 RepID=A0A557RR09_9RHOO|nr:MULTISPECIES: DUF3304 domain-containing protein [Denitromonas]TVO59111.1 DUF3304 domain-containing protein [Denitromonas halophila]TVO67607.1 DUF3304 domain-containing protein [Denitromonas ohlonensis]TVO76465.1 DUF3304 domain-containing protein [Denitromonas ohlonensis]